MRRKARERLTTRIKVVWTINSGNAKSRGLSPCQTPFDEVLMEVIFTTIFIIISICLPLKKTPQQYYKVVMKKMGNE